MQTNIWYKGVAVLFTIAKKKKKRKKERKETTLMSTNQIDEGGIFIQWNIIQAQNKMNNDTCYSMDEPQKYAKWLKADTRGHILHDSTYTKYLQ